MNRAKHILVCLFFALGCGAIAGESNNLPQVKTEQHVIIMPTNFIRQIASADHVIVGMRFQDPEFKSVNLDLTGERARNVVKAVSQLKNDRIVGWIPSRCNCEFWTLEFYHATNRLAVASFVRDVVDIDDEYRDKTGTLSKIDSEMMAMLKKRDLELFKSHWTNSAPNPALGPKPN